MAINWITEPNDYNGAVGSTMPVNAQVNIPTPLIYGQGNTPFNNGDWSIVEGTGIIDTNYVSCTNNTGNLNSRAFGNTPFKVGNVLETYVTYTSGTWFWNRVASTINSANQIAFLSVEGGEVEIIIDSQGGTILRESLGFDAQVGDIYHTIVTFGSDNISVWYEVERTGSVLATGEYTDIFFAGVTDTLPSCWAFLGTVTTTYVSVTSLINFNLKDNLGTSRLTQVSTDSFFNEAIPNMQTVDTGSWTLEAESNGSTITSPFSVVVSNDVYQSDGLTEIPQGDPKMFIGANGMDLRFVGGIPVMDDGLENVATISLGTRNGFALNKIASNGAEAVGSTFIEESLKSITVEQIAILEDAAEKSFSWAVSDGLIEKATATVSAGERGYQLEIVLTPPTGENRILVYTKNGENWVNQKS